MLVSLNDKLVFIDSFSICIHVKQISINAQFKIWIVSKKKNAEKSLGKSRNFLKDEEAAAQIIS